jgi:hypothetical protein
MSVAIADAYRNIVVTTGVGGVSGIATATGVGSSLHLNAGFGISLVADPTNNKITIVNTGNGAGALTTITDLNSNNTYYPIFTRAPGPDDVNPIISTYQMDTMYLDQTITPLTYNPSLNTLTCSSFTGNLTGNASTVTDGFYTSSSLYIGTTSIAVNRASGAISLTGVSIDGNASTVTDGFYTSSSLYIGTTSIAVNRASGAISLTGVSIDGNAANLSGGNDTTLIGAVLFQSALNVTSKLSPNTSLTKKLLSQAGDGTYGSAPIWATISSTDVGLNNVENTALSTWSGTSNITSVGTLSSLHVSGTIYQNDVIVPNMITLLTYQLAF